jgi:phosphatidylglycerophosphatase A
MQEGRRWDALALGVATLGGAGRSPIVPGTAGTLAALPLVVVAGLWLPLWAYALATLLLTGVAIVTSGAAARLLGRHDPGAVVIDEAAGLFVTLLAVPIHIGSVAAGFLLFRVMDVIKPPPARQAERLPAGWGIVVDDLVAGLYANVALRLGLALARHLSG